MPRGSAPFPPAGRREVPALPSAARSRGAPFPSAWGSQADAAGINGATDAGLMPSSAAVPGSVVATIPDDRLFTILRAAVDAPRVEARDQPPRRVLQREAFVVGGGRLRRGQLFRGAGERVGQEARAILIEARLPRECFEVKRSCRDARHHFGLTHRGGGVAGAAVLRLAESAHADKGRDLGGNRASRRARPLTRRLEA